jgi:hypothetical protein
LSFDSSRRPSQVHSRDVDGNGTLDLVLTNGFRQRVAVFLNDGSGTFRPAADDQFLADPDDDDFALASRPRTGAITALGPPAPTWSLHISRASLWPVLNEGLASRRPHALTRQASEPLTPTRIRAP